MKFAESSSCPLLNLRPCQAIGSQTVPEVLVIAIVQFYLTGGDGPARYHAFYLTRLSIWATWGHLRTLSAVDLSG